MKFGVVQCKQIALKEMRSNFLLIKTQKREINGRLLFSSMNPLCGCVFG